MRVAFVQFPAVTRSNQHPHPHSDSKARSRNYPRLVTVGARPSCDIALFAHSLRRVRRWHRLL